MDENEARKLVGKRLLLTDRITGISRRESTLLEVSPSGKVAKFRNELATDCVFWKDLDEVELLEVLQDSDEERREIAEFLSKTLYAQS